MISFTGKRWYSLFRNHCSAQFRGEFSISRKGCHCLALSPLLLYLQCQVKWHWADRSQAFHWKGALLEADWPWAFPRRSTGEDHLVVYCLFLWLSLSCVWLFATPWAAAHWAPLSFSTSNPYSLSQWCYLTISSSAAPSPFAFNLSQHQGLFQWVSSSHQVAKVLEFQLQHQSFQWTFRVDFL